MCVASCLKISHIDLPFCSVLVHAYNLRPEYVGHMWHTPIIANIASSIPALSPARPGARPRCLGKESNAPRDLGRAARPASLRQRVSAVARSTPKAAHTPNGTSTPQDTLHHHPRVRTTPKQAQKCKLPHQHVVSVLGGAGTRREWAATLGVCILARSPLPPRVSRLICCSSWSSGPSPRRPLYARFAPSHRAVSSARPAPRA